VISRWRRQPQVWRAINAEQAVRDRAAIARRKALGLCRDCAAPAAPFFRCATCRRLHVEDKRAARERRRSA
jgi:hypothetical protein